jgi:hypothetical protein
VQVIHQQVAVGAGGKALVAQGIQHAGHRAAYALDRHGGKPAK